MGNACIPPNDSEMLQKLDLELEKHNDIPLLPLGDLNARHPIWDKDCKAPNKNGKVLEDMSRHNVQIQNNKNATCVYKRGSSTQIQYLKEVSVTWKCQTKEFVLINTCHKGITTTSNNKRPII